MFTHIKSHEKRGLVIHPYTVYDDEVVKEKLIFILLFLLCFHNVRQHGSPEGVLQKCTQTITRGAGGTRTALGSGFRVKTKPEGVLRSRDVKTMRFLREEMIALADAIWLAILV